MQKLIQISEAAKFLDVSIDTVRRYDKLGILHSTRPGGKVRYFDLEELKAVKSSKPFILVSSRKSNLTPSIHLHKKTYRVGLLLIRIVILLVTVLTILFLLLPQQTARFFTSFL